MDIAVLFPTLVGVTQADQQTIALIHEEVLAQKNKMEGLLSHSWGDNVLSSFDKEKNIFVSAQLHNLKKFVEENILQFVNKTRDDKNWTFDHDYSQSWVNITRKFGFQERHNHERNAEGLPISGAYYFNTNKNDGDLAIFPTDIQYKLFGNHVIAPEIGKLVLFRSEVFHRVSANLTDSDRISFSFNYLLTKQ